MLLFIPRSLCALKRVAAKTEHCRFGATTGIRIALASGLFRAEACDGHRAIVVQGLIPAQDPPWPGFKDLPDDACEAIILPKDLERACKLGDWLQERFDSIGLATVGNEVYLGLGSDLISTRTVEGRFPELARVIPTKRPLFSFRVDPKRLAETLLAMSELLSDGEAVQCFYYGDDQPLGFCARNEDTGMMIDALIVPLFVPKDNPKPGNQANENTQTTESEDAKSDHPRTRRRTKKPVPEDAGDATPDPTNPMPEQPKAQEMRQYQEVKQRHPGMLLLFRMGDFYEVFEDDAEVAAKVLGLTLTSRDKIPMAGFPHHSLETHLRKLLQAGHRIAICDQVENDPTIKVRREVTRVVTPGTITEDAEEAQP